MKIEQLPSGSFRIRQQYKCKRYTIVVDYKPSKKEAIELIAEAMKDAKKPEKTPLTFSEAYTAYLDMKSNVLSPSTKRGYKSLKNNLPEAFLQEKLSNITSIDIQKLVNDYSADHSPKSTLNMYSFVITIIKTFTGVMLTAKLPQPKKLNPYIPTSEEVAKIMQEIKPTKYYVPTCLACLGLRLSEITALSAEDLADDNTILINKALVKDENNKYILKDSTKTTYSTRTITVPSDIADIIRQQGYVYNGSPNFIYKNLISVENRLGIQHFSLHKLRHFFATYAHNELHLSDKQIMSAGGWKSRTIMDTVYTHTMKQNEASQKLANEIGKLF